MVLIIIYIIDLINIVFCEEKFICICNINISVVLVQIVNTFTWGGLVGKDELQVTVNPDVDYAFIVTLVAILIEIRSSRRRNSTHHHNSHMT